ncbi:MAG: ribosomal RNA small subunit methyltransferase A [Acidobacteria bacterium]|nr:ribosomal RNA small subunit methyltransferase A [Acidobacteriota bacterium]
MRARKRFGQNFLEPAWVAKVVQAIAPRADQTFLEIGPGRGALTRPLAARAKTVVAYEIDRDLAAGLEATAPPNITIVVGDFLTAGSLTKVVGADPCVGPGADTRVRPYMGLRVAGNLPYNVASPILFKLVELRAGGCPLVDATVMLQREVGDRLLAAPGSREYGVLSVLMQHTASIERLLDLPAGAFRPRPKVRSVLVRLTFHPPNPPVADAATFSALVRAVFTRRRKTLANALLAYPARDARGGPAVNPTDVLRRAGVDGARRPETLSVAEFARLADIYASVSP